MERQKFLENFQLLESAVCTHCLNNGENLHVSDAWKSLQKQGIITEEEFEIKKNKLINS